MQGRLKWLICAALAATVVFSLMTYFDPVSLWFHHKVKETEIQHTRAQTVDKEHQPATQNSSTLQDIDWDVGVQRLDPIVYSEPCSGTINDSRRTTLFKDYDKVQHYLDDFFGSIADINALPKDADPVFITGVSSNHLRESMNMFNNFNSVVRKMKPNVRMIFYDLGLQADEPDQIKAICQCEYRLFPFEYFPAYVKELKGYAWKPLLIMMVLKEYPFAVWMDSSILFTTSNISGLLDMARRLDVICTPGGGSVALRTLPVTFGFFREKACTFRKLPEIQAGFFIARTTPFVVQNILKPWIACALVIDCIVPHDGWQKYYRCGLHGNVYGDCHRRLRCGFDALRSDINN
ncbi:uncharacterized protein LOC127839839 [Dreissena polymorpha]|uniref:uncharacterized protein LOC127839839 n=1 Tax=Dreissena polymorpha TaxID=45954 RepID=UPI00226556DD|nr:uncharacterized protein LOC127839839 [Dreissena polymorpha]